MLLAHFRVGTRLMVGFTILLVITISITVAALSDMRQIQASLSQVAETDMPSIALVNSMRDAVRFQGIALRDIIIQEDLAFKKKELKLIRAAREQYQTSAKTLAERPLDAEIKAQLHALEAQEIKVKEATSAAIDLSLNDQHVEAAESIREVVRPAQQDLIEKLETLLKYVEEEAVHSSAAGGETYKQAVKSLTFAATVCVILGMLTALITTRSIVNPLRAAVRAASYVASGDLTHKIEVKGRDETAELSSALHNMQTQLSELIRGVQAASDSMAATSGVVVSSIGEFSERVDCSASIILSGRRQL